MEVLNKENIYVIRKYRLELADQSTTIEDSVKENNISAVAVDVAEVRAPQRVWVGFETLTQTQTQPRAICCNVQCGH